MTRTRRRKQPIPKLPGRLVLGVLLALIGAVAPAAGQPANDSCENAEPLAGAPDFVFRSTADATADPEAVDCNGVSATAPGIWFSLTVGADTCITASTCLAGGEADFNTSISVYTGDCDSDLTCVAANDDDNAFCFDGGSTVRWCAEGSVTYLIFVHGFGATGDFSMSVNDAPGCETCECTEPPPSMEAWWSGDDCTASDLLERHDGDFVGLPDCPLPVKVGFGAMRFIPPPLGGSTGTYAIVDDSEFLDPNRGELTVDAWIWLEPPPFGGYQPIISKGRAGRRGWSLGVNSGVLEFELRDGRGNSLLASGGSISPNTWHHVAGTLQRTPRGARARVFVDGVQRGTDASGRFFSVSTSRDLLLGARANASGNGVVVLDGILDEVELFQRELKLEEIRRIWIACTFGKCKPPECCDTCEFIRLLADTQGNPLPTSDPCHLGDVKEEPSGPCCQALEYYWETFEGGDLPFDHPCFER